MSSDNSRFRYVQMPDGVKVKAAVVNSELDLRLHLPEFISGARSSNSNNGLFVGFDTEWTSRNNYRLPCHSKTALLKLCNISGFCLLIALQRFVKGTHAVGELLAIREITYAGVNISKQLDKLKEDYGLEIRTTVELSSVYARLRTDIGAFGARSWQISLGGLNLLWKRIYGSNPREADEDLLFWLLDSPWSDFGIHSNDKQVEYVVFSAYAAVKIANNISYSVAASSVARVTECLSRPVLISEHCGHATT